MTHVHVNPGSCGLEAEIQADTDDTGRIRLEVRSDCPSVVDLAACIGPVDPYSEKGTFFDSPVYRCADACLKHVDCIVPAAFVRAIQIEAGIALPETASIEARKG